MNITRDNYEIYIIDYLDNNLTKKQVAELKRFLEANPDIKEEAEGLAPLALNDESVKYPEKETLKTIANVEDFNISEADYLAVADLEGDITDEEKYRLKNISKNNEQILDDIALYRKTKLKTDLNLKYPEKSTLYTIAKHQGMEIAYFDYLIIADLEGDITEEESKELNSLLQNSKTTATQTKLYQQARLKPDQAIRFENKDELKHKHISINSNYTYMPVAVAAAITAMFFIIGSLLTPKELVNTGTMASINFSDDLRTYTPIINELEPETTRVYSDNATAGNQYAVITDNNVIEETEDNQNEQYRPLDLPEAFISIPKAEAYVFAQNNRNDLPTADELPINSYDYNPIYQNDINKNQVWVIAEKSVDVWRTLTSGDLIMANSYNEKGEIERLEIRGNRVGITRTFYRE